MGKEIKGEKREKKKKIGEDVTFDSIKSQILEKHNLTLFIRYNGSKDDLDWRIDFRYFDFI